ncbi:MAG: nucleotidyltransferase domain-containing protein [Geminicoccaceae bacterium]|nr:nucleotidyltransferase domain-containing protein [Geminicoccaceae bacterium]
MEADKLERAVALLRERLPGLMAVYHFGSTADGTAWPSSDVDLAVMGEGLVDGPALWNLRPELERVFGRDVDLLDLRRVSSVMQNQVLLGRRLWCRDPAAVDWQETAMLGMYRDLRELRVPILAELLKP